MSPSRTIRVLVLPALALSTACSSPTLAWGAYDATRGGFVYTDASAASTGQEEEAGLFEDVRAGMGVHPIGIVPDDDLILDALIRDRSSIDLRRR